MRLGHVWVLFDWHRLLRPVHGGVFCQNKHRHEPDKAGDANQGEARHALDAGQVGSCLHRDDT